MPVLEKYKTLANSQFSSPSIRQPPTLHKKILEDISLDSPAILHQRNSIFTLCWHFGRTFSLFFGRTLIKNHWNLKQCQEFPQLSLNLIRWRAKLNNIHLSMWCIMLKTFDKQETGAHLEIVFQPGDEVGSQAGPHSATSHQAGGI